MNDFKEIINRYLMFHDEFSKNIRDDFGASISNEGLTIIDRNINILCKHEIVIDIELLKINKLLLEAKSILPDLGA